MDKKRLWPALIGVLAIAVVGGALFLVLSFSTPPSCRLVAGTPVASPMVRTSASTIRPSAKTPRAAGPPFPSARPVDPNGSR